MAGGGVVLADMTRGVSALLSGQGGIDWTTLAGAAAKQDKGMRRGVGIREKGPVTSN